MSAAYTSIMDSQFKPAIDNILKAILLQGQNGNLFATKGQIYTFAGTQFRLPKDKSQYPACFNGNEIKVNVLTVVGTPTTNNLKELTIALTANPFVNFWNLELHFSANRADQEFSAKYKLYANTFSPPLSLDDLAVVAEAISLGDIQQPQQNYGVTNWQDPEVKKVLTEFTAFGFVQNFQNENEISI